MKLSIALVACGLMLYSGGIMAQTKIHKKCGPEVYLIHAAWFKLRC
jgi:hypothetical protein